MGGGLNARFVKTVTKPGTYSDGPGAHGLNLRIRSGARGVSRTWIQRIRIGGQPTYLGLGPADLVTLAEARRKALENRAAVYRGEDPRRRAKRGPAVPTFAEAAETVIALHAKGWKDPGRMGGQWRQTLRAYAFPVIGDKPISEITPRNVLAVLSPIWNTKAATARIVRQRIGAVMKWAVAKGYRESNPAGDAITAALPRKNGGTKHHAAIPHRELTAALAKVRAMRISESVKLCFTFVALTGTRSTEARGARWSEVDRERRVWTIPASRMKTRREHAVPLSDAALTVLAEARKLGDGRLCFPSPRSARILNAVTLQNVAKHFGATVHGLRTSLRTWASEQGVPGDVGEAILAHRPRGLEAVYRDSDLLERRREVMEEWGSYIAA